MIEPRYTLVWSPASITQWQDLDHDDAQMVANNVTLLIHDPYPINMSAPLDGDDELFLLAIGNVGVIYRVIGLTVYVEDIQTKE